MAVWIIFTLLSISQAFLLGKNKVCFGELGCFGNGFPFWSVERPISLLPASPQDIGTRFLLYSRANPPDRTEELFIGAPKSVNGSSFNASLPTKFIVHGFTHNAHRPWVQKMVWQMLKQESLNVIAVEWNKGASIPYSQATANTRVVGAQIGLLINFLMTRTGATSDQFHIIGHSLGAHIAGYAGEKVSHLGRITGLDPAGPYYQDTQPVVRLDPTDADYIDVIHSDGTSIFSLGLGTLETMGHVDFYPNGGLNQPGCPTALGTKFGQIVWSAITIGYLGAEEALSCSHMASIHFFTESINTDCPYQAYPCVKGGDFLAGKCLACHGQCATMGYHADKSEARGSYYLATQATSPYCSYHYLVNITVAEKFSGKMSVTLYGTLGETDNATIQKKNTVVGAGDTMSDLVVTPYDIGPVTRAKLYYDKDTDFLTAWLYPKTIQLSKIHLFQAESQNVTTFCTKSKDVTASQAVTFTAGCQR